MAKISFSKLTGGGGKSTGRRLIMVVVVLALGLMGVFGAFTTYVHPYEIAIKQSRYGGGLDVKPYEGPGLYLTPPGVTFHRFPTVVQTLLMASSKSESAQTNSNSNSRTIDSLEIDSSDGSKIRIDATILYRITDPYKVMTKIGPGRLFEDNAIIPKASQALKQSLGTLKAEDFYNEVLRIEATNRARLELNELVNEFGIDIDHVLIRQYYYLKDYQHQIEERKVQDQLVFTNQSMAEKSKMEALRRKFDAQGEATVAIEGRRGEAEVTKIRAEAQLYSRKRRAEGNLLVSLAEAKGTELENAAYRGSSGSENLVGLEMAEVLSGVDVIFLQGGEGGVNLLDLNQTVELFDVGGR